MLQSNHRRGNSRRRISRAVGIRFLKRIGSAGLPLAEPNDRTEGSGMSEESKSRYQQYLKSAHWMAFKRLKTQSVPKKCAACSSGDKVQLHHMIYRDPIELAQLDDTCWLCGDCHETFHQRVGQALKGVPYAQLLAETVRIILATAVVVPKKQEAPKKPKKNRKPKSKWRSFRVARKRYAAITGTGAVHNSKPIPGVVVVRPKN